MDHKDGISGFRKFAITVTGSINWSPTSGIYGCSLEHSLSGEQLPRPAYYAIIDRRARRPIRVLRPRNEGGGAPPTFSFVHASASTDVSLYWPRNSCSVSISIRQKGWNRSCCVSWSRFDTNIANMIEKGVFDLDYHFLFFDSSDNFSGDKGNSVFLSA